MEGGPGIQAEIEIGFVDVAILVPEKIGNELAPEDRRIVDGIEAGCLEPAYTEGTPALGDFTDGNVLVGNIVLNPAKIVLGEQ